MCLTCLFFRAPASIGGEEVSLLKILYGVSNGLFIIAWFIATAFSKTALSDLDLDPDSDDEYDSDEDETTAVDEMD